MRNSIFFISALIVAVVFASNSYSQEDDHEKHHPEKNSQTSTSGKKMGSSSMQECSKGEDCPMKNNKEMMKTCMIMMQGKGLDMGMMQGEGMGMMHGKGMGMMPMMKMDKVNLNVAEINSGIIVKFSSDDMEAVKMLKSMGEKMKKMHPMMKEKMGKMMKNNQMGKQHGMMDHQH